MENSNYIKVPVALLVSFALANTTLFGEISPFAAAFASSLSGLSLLAGVVGSVTGFAFGGDIIPALSHIAAIVAVSAFRLIAGFFPTPAAFMGRKAGPDEKSPGTGDTLRNTGIMAVLTPIVAGMAVFSLTVVSETTVAGIFQSAAAGVIAAAASFSLIKTMGVFTKFYSYRCQRGKIPDNYSNPADKSYPGGKLSRLISRTEVFALTLTFIFALTAAACFSFYFISAGIVLAGAATLIAAARNGIPGAAVCGTFAAFAIAVSDAGGGLFPCLIPIAGIFSAFAGFNVKHLRHRGVFSSAYLLAATLTGVMLGGGDFMPAITFIGSSAAAAFLYAVIPFERWVVSYDVSPGGKPGRLPENKAVYSLFSNRLSDLSEALTEVKDAVEKTAAVLDGRESRDISWVYNSACDEVCRKCRYNMTCWGEEYGDTVRAMTVLMKLMRQGQLLTGQDLPGNISARCEKQGRSDTFAAEINHRYREYVSVNAAVRKVADARRIVTSQLSAGAKLLSGVAREFAEFTLNGNTDDVSRIESVLRSCGLFQPVVTLIGKSDRMVVEASGSGRLSVPAEKLPGLLEIAVGTSFSPPEITFADGITRIEICARPQYSVEIAGAQKPRSREKNCGDYYETWSDGRGFAYILLSDGMGTGGRARIDSSFACGMLARLIRSGVGVDISAAIEIVNNSLLVKSADESFATLDIARIDLHSGKTEIFKAGAAPSYVKCGTKVLKAAAKSLPVGISPAPTFSTQHFTIGKNDVLIMMSDGAEPSERWLRSELLSDNLSAESMETIAESIVGAAAVCGDSDYPRYDDDVSVIAVRLC
ncbi:hypothetical protein FACS189499_00730 [Clostridia bacterium]|nr:hypothetical protein FACS189499_00730 [Clostridia bacterium]